MLYGVVSFGLANTKVKSTRRVVGLGVWVLL